MHLARSGSIRQSGSVRRGFTLLEVLLSTAIALMLLAALYSTMNMVLRQTQEGRELLDQSTVARTLIQKFNADLAGVLTPVPAPAATSTSDTAAATTSAMTPASETSSSSIVPFQAGVIGDSTSMTLFLARVPTPPQADNNGLSADDTPTPSDIRRISWWLSATGGIARQERQWLLSDDISRQTEPDRSTEADDILASEATDLTFEYWDGSAWQTSWDGSQLGSDAKTPTGPPLAVRVSLWVKQPDSAVRDTIGETKKYTHVIALQTAPGVASPTSAGSP